MVGEDKTEPNNLFEIRKYQFIINMAYQFCFAGRQPCTNLSSQ